MYVLTKGHVVIGYYDTQAEATAALVEEYDKEDGVELGFRRLEEEDPSQAQDAPAEGRLTERRDPCGQESEIRY